jgi:hypothetical protein
MKKILFIIVLPFLVNTLIQAQTPISSKSQRTGSIPLTPSPTAKSYQAQTLPDLKVISISIAKLSSSQLAAGLTNYAFEVSYTVKNEGNIAIDARSVVIGGTIDYENATVTRPIGGCGGSLTTLSGNLINPGATYGGSYRCHNVSLENSRRYIYSIKVDQNNRVTELNEQNNTAQISILF